MKILISGMALWHMGKTAYHLSRMGRLSSIWVSSKNPGLPEEEYRRIWPYHLAMKPFYHWAPPNLEERMRWKNLWLYDWWVKRQSLPDSVDVVHCPMGSCTPVFDLAEACGRPILKVFEAMNGHPTMQRGYWQREADIHSPGFVIPVGQRIWARMNREIHRADCVLCPSTYVKETMIANGVPEEKCLLNHFGVDTALFSRRRNSDIALFPKFIIVGNLTVRKGQQYLFEAFKKLHEEYPEAELHSFGDPRPDFKDLWKRWKGFPNLHLHHSVPQAELSQHLSSSTAFILPSLEEGFARSLLEAMAIGLPVIATHESGATTLLDEQSALIVPAANPEAIYQAMKKLCKHPSLVEELGDQAYFRFGPDNTWEAYAHRLACNYEKRFENLRSKLMV